MEPKEDIEERLGYSLDHSDAFVQTHAEPVSPRNAARIHGARQSKALADHDGFKEYFDKQQMEGLEKFATQNLGAALDRKRGGLGGAVGSQTPGDIKTAFGSPEMILAHEILHCIRGYWHPAWGKICATPPRIIFSVPRAPR